MIKMVTLTLISVMFSLGTAQQVSGDSLVKMLEQAKGYYNNGEFENAINELQRALQYLKQLNQNDQVEAYKYLAFSYVAFGDKLKAKEQFRKALVLDPNLELDPATVSPKIIKVFEEVKSEISVKPPIPPVVQPTEPVIGPRGGISTFGATARSCCLPGWGQMYKGEGSKGKKLMIYSGIAFGTALISQVISNNKHNVYLDVEPGDTDEMAQAYNSYKFWYNAAALTTTTFIGLYFYNIYDVVFTKAKIKSSMNKPDNGFYCAMQRGYFQVGYNVRLK